MVIDSIAFIGDSFTWGEALEFYQNTPKWISQRKKPSSWMEYKDIIEPADNVFREQNRWAGIVSEYFKSHMIIDDRNGGAFISIQHWLNNVEPNHVSSNWSGDTMGKQHKSQTIQDIEWSRS